MKKLLSRAEHTLWSAVVLRMTPELARRGQSPEYVVHLASEFADAAVLERRQRLVDRPGLTVPLMEGQTSRGS